MTHTIKDYLLVEVPEDASDFVIHTLSLIGTESPYDKLVFSSRIQDPCKCGGDMIILPTGNWQYITTSELISEEQCKEIVEADILGGYKEYSNDEYDFLPWITALDSFKSLLRSLNLKRAAVLKNQENNLLK